MSGFVAVYYLNGRPMDPSDLARMVAEIAHRGPDGSGHWCEKSIGLGHRMLWTTPESVSEKLPFVSSPNGLAITADARIDNRADLIAALNLADDVEREITDSQLILAAYEKWGPNCPDQLIGDFAFVIWDGQQRKLFCARDPMGIKPLYYYYRPGQIFVCASEIKALLCLAEVPRRLNERKVANHLTRIFEDGGMTYYQDILSLPAAHHLTIDQSGLQQQAYWSMDLAQEIQFSSNEAYAEAFRDILTEAVRCRLRSTLPVGTTLSGGLDSSSIACLSHKLYVEAEQQDLHTFSAIFPSLPASDLEKIDERRYMQAVLATGKFKSSFVRADHLSPLHNYDRVFWHEDEAVQAPNLYMHWALYEAAQQQGVRIFLDGIDGDSTVSHGLEYLPELARTGRWHTLTREARALAKRANNGVSTRRVMWRHGLRPLVPASMLTLWHAIRHRHLPPEQTVFSVIDPQFAHRIGLTEQAQTRLRLTPGRTFRENHWYGLRSSLITTTMELADKAASAFSIEARYPFFDRRLIEFCIALPLNQKLNQGWTRWIQRQAMDGILPQEVQWRFTKGNLGFNFKRRLLECEQKTVQDVLSNYASVIEPYVDLPALQAAYERYSAQPLRTENEALAIFGAVTLALWLQHTGLSA